MSFMSKTRSFIGLSSLRSLVSDSMAIDMGSAGTIIAVRGRGIVATVGSGGMNKTESKVDFKLRPVGDSSPGWQS